MSKCLVCQGKLEESEQDYHSACAKTLFGRAVAPQLDLRYDTLESAAADWLKTNTTVTGVQPKVALQWQSGKSPRLTLVGALGGSHILKTPHPEYAHMPELEAVCMRLAATSNLPVVPHGLIRMASGELAYITKRIDRRADGTKIAMEDMCQLAGRQSVDKYKGSHEQVAQLINSYSSQPLLDLVRYYEIVLFSFLIGNNDMHLKNFSLYAGGPRNGYVLTPAYDLLAVQLLMPSDDEDLALTAAGRKKKLTKANFAEAMGRVLPATVQDRLWRRVLAASAGWMSIIKNSFLPSPMKQDLIDRIEERQARLQ